MNNTTIQFHGNNSRCHEPSTLHAVNFLRDDSYMARLFALGCYWRRCLSTVRSILHGRINSHSKMLLFCASVGSIGFVYCHGVNKDRSFPISSSFAEHWGKKDPTCGLPFVIHTMKLYEILFDCVEGTIVKSNCEMKSKSLSHII